MVSVKEVKSKRELRKYVSFPNKLYKDCEQYIPPIFGDELDDWNRKKNPAFEYCEGKCFLAYRDGAIVGRIGAILSKRANEKWNLNRMRFTQVDFIDDFEVSSALFAAVEEYARGKGCDQVHGPLGFCDLDREGMLVEGYDRRSMFITYYNHPYYIKHLERLGYTKDVDWVEDMLTVPYDEKTVKRVYDLADYVEKHQKLHIASLKRRKDYPSYVRSVFELLNVAYGDLYGTVVLSQSQIDRYCKKYIPLIDPRFACFVMNENEELVGFSLAAPSLADALKRSGGHLFPFGFVRVLRALKKNDALDMFLVAVRPDYRGKGANALMIKHFVSSARSMNMRVAETGPQLETNEKVQSQWRFFETVQHKRRRCFIKSI